jgi:hypothetical protein
MKWKNRSGTLEVEVPMVIEFLSSGYYDPGNNCGPMDGSYPPEGEDERVLDCITIDGIELPKEIAEKLFDKYQEAVDAVEMELPEPDYD